MIRHVALLRGINVGGHNRLPMADLRHALAGAGFDQVASYIQSGNVAFSSPKAVDAARITTLLRDEFELDVPVVVFTADEVAAIAAQNPFMSEEASETFEHVLFLSEAPPPERFAELDIERFAPDEAALDGRALYVHYHDGVSGSKLTIDIVERALGVTVTGRNMRTVAKLVEL